MDLGSSACSCDHSVMSSRKFPSSGRGRVREDEAHCERDWRVGVFAHGIDVGAVVAERTHDRHVARGCTPMAEAARGAAPASLARGAAVPQRSATLRDIARNRFRVGVRAAPQRRSPVARCSGESPVRIRESTAHFARSRASTTPSKPAEELRATARVDDRRRATSVRCAAFAAAPLATGRHELRLEATSPSETTGKAAAARRESA
jgi:hypothetical protein